MDTYGLGNYVNWNTLLTLTFNLFDSLKYDHNLDEKKVFSSGLDDAFCFLSVW